MNGTNYFPTPNSLGTRTHFVFDAPGLDANLWSKVDGDNAIGRLATLLQDVVDGHEAGPGVPNNGDYWMFQLPSKVTRRFGLPPYGQSDAEDVRLGGAAIEGVVQSFMDARPGGHYTVAALERGVGKFVREKTNWCRTCRMTAPHFVDYSSGVLDPRRLMRDCAQDPALSAALGAPPTGDVSLLDAHTCEPCPPGQGMLADGTCSACVVDRSLNWSAITQSCHREYIPYSTQTWDNCPESFSVEVFSANDGPHPLRNLQVGPRNHQMSGFACLTSQLAVTAQRRPFLGRPTSQHRAGRRLGSTTARYSGLLLNN